MTAIRLMQRCCVVCIFLLSLMPAGFSRGESPRFTVTLYGLTDAEHTRYDGTQYSGPSSGGSDYDSLLPTGEIRGYSIQMQGDAYGGWSSWISRGRETVRVGLIDADHTGVDGLRYTAIDATNQQGQLAGTSMRFVDGVSQGGISAWFYDGVETRRIGLFEQAKPNDIPSLVEYASTMNEPGQVAGGSTNTSDWHNQQFKWAWINDPASGPVRIGLDADENLTAAGGSFNAISSLNNRGQAIGLAARKDRDGVLRGNPSGRNQSAWFFDGTNTIQIGYTDDLHTGDFGSRSSTPLWLTDSGIVAGDSKQFMHIPGCATDSSCIWEADLGNTAWTYRDGNYRNIGLTDERFIDRNGFTSSYIARISETGWTAGTSELRGGSSVNYVPWVDDGMATHEIAVPPPKFTDEQSSYPRIEALTDHGMVVASTVYYGYGEGEQRTESRAWRYANGELRLIGLTGNEYRGIDGSIRNDVLEVIGDRYVVGTVQNDSNDHNTLWVDDGVVTRALEIDPDGPTALSGPYSDLRGFNGSGQLLGRTYQQMTTGDWETKNWVYDPSGLITFIDVPEGKELFASGITESGWVYGQIGDGWFTNSDAFIWNASTGLLRLADLLDESQLPEGTRLVAAVNGMNGNRFAGYAYTDQSSWAFMAVAVPEPASFVVAILGLFGVNALDERSRRRAKQVKSLGRGRWPRAAKSPGRFARG